MTLAPSDSLTERAQNKPPVFSKGDIVLGWLLVVVLVLVGLVLADEYLRPAIQNGIVNSTSIPASGIANNVNYTIVPSSITTSTKSLGPRVVFYKNFNYSMSERGVKVAFIEKDGTEHVFYIPDDKFRVYLDDFGAKTYASFDFKKYDPSKSLQANINQNLNEMQWSLSNKLYRQLRYNG